MCGGDLKCAVLSKVRDELAMYAVASFAVPLDFCAIRFYGAILRVLHCAFRFAFSLSRSLRTDPTSTFDRADDVLDLECLCGVYNLCFFYLCVTPITTQAI